MDAILRSLKPDECMRIISGTQTIILTKTKPKLGRGHKEYIYETKASKKLDLDLYKYYTFNPNYNNSLTAPPPLFIENTGVRNGKVIGEFICEKVETFSAKWIPTPFYNNAYFSTFIHTRKAAYLDIKEEGTEKIEGRIIFEYPDKYLDSVLTLEELSKTGKTVDELFDYAGFNRIYAIYISNLRIYKNPIEITQFKKPKSILPCEIGRCEFFDRYCTAEHCPHKCVNKPPQNLCYVQEIE